MSMFYVLGVDPGFANVGYALCACRRSASGQREVVPVEAGVIRTEKSDKKLKLLASDDNTRRMREISAAVDKILGEGRGFRSVTAICMESMSFPRNASNAAKMAMSWGIVVALAHTRKAAILQASPQQIKLKLAGAKSASKEEIQAAIDRVTDGKFAETLVDHRGQPLKQKALLEHPYDAMAAVLTCLDNEALGFAWMMSEALRVSNS